MKVAHTWGIGIPETPTPLELANIGNGDTPPPKDYPEFEKMLIAN